MQLDRQRSSVQAIHLCQLMEAPKFKVLHCGVQLGSLVELLHLQCRWLSVCTGVAVGLWIRFAAVEEAVEKDSLPFWLKRDIHQCIVHFQLFTK